MKNRRFIIFGSLLIIITIGVLVPFLVWNFRHSDSAFSPARPTNQPAQSLATIQAGAPSQGINVPLNNCTYPTEFWSERPSAWPEQVTIGDVRYSREEMLPIFNAQADDPASRLLVSIYTTFLNVLYGANISVIEPTLLDANTWLSLNPPGSPLSEFNRQRGAELVSVLDAFNDGDFGPGLCPDLPVTGDSAGGLSEAASTEVARAAFPTQEPTPGDGSQIDPGLQLPTQTAPPSGSDQPAPQPLPTSPVDQTSLGSPTPVPTLSQASSPTPTISGPIAPTFTPTSPTPVLRTPTVRPTNTSHPTSPPATPTSLPAPTNTLHPTNPSATPTAPPAPTNTLHPTNPPATSTSPPVPTNTLQPTSPPATSTALPVLTNTPQSTSPPPSPTTPPSSDPCSGGGGSLGDLRVTTGTTCTLNGTRVSGNIFVEQNATLVAQSVQVGGNIQGQNANLVDVGSGSSVGGNVQISDSGSARIVSVRINGDLQLNSNRGGSEASQNQVGGNLQAFDNSGGISISGNTINGNLQCKDNNPPPTGGGNNVGGNAEDQCATMG